MLVASVIIENREGDWVGSASGVLGLGPPQELVTLHGEGAYEGLTAMFRMDDTAAEGVVAPSDLPALPAGRPHEVTAGRGQPAPVAGSIGGRVDTASGGMSLAQPPVAILLAATRLPCPSTGDPAMIGTTRGAWGRRPRTDSHPSQTWLKPVTPGVGHSAAAGVTLAPPPRGPFPGTLSRRTPGRVRNKQRRAPRDRDPNRPAPPPLWCEHGDPATRGQHPSTQPCLVALLTDAIDRLEASRSRMAATRSPSRDRAAGDLGDIIGRLKALRAPLCHLGHGRRRTMTGTADTGFVGPASMASRPATWQGCGAMRPRIR